MKKEDAISFDDILPEKEEVQTMKKTAPKRGRPPKQNESANKRVVLYFTPSQLEEVEEYCHQNRIKTGTFVKETFFKAFSGKKEDQDTIKEWVENLDEKEMGALIKAYLIGD